MAKRLRKFVLPSVVTSLTIVGTLCIKTSIDTLKPQKKGSFNVLMSKIEEDHTYHVLEEIEVDKPLYPYVEETVGQHVDYYRSDDDEETQKNSLIYYEKTYMPSTGILYSAEEVFDVYTVLNGEVTDVGEDNILGKYIEVNHGNGVKTLYYSLSETNVTKGTIVDKGDVIGISGSNRIENSLQNNLIFESYIDGKLVDPEDFYNMDFSKKN